MDGSQLLSTQIMNFVTISYFASMVCFIVFLAVRSKKVSLTANAIAWLGFAAHTFALGYRWYESYQLPGGVGHAPLSNLYESVVFFAWTIILIYIILDLKYKQDAVGAFVIPFAFFGMIGAQLLLNSGISPLVPALQSNWLTYHVITCFLGYAAFAVACGVSVMYIVKAYYEEDQYRKSAAILALSVGICSAFLVWIAMNFAAGYFSIDLSFAIRLIIVIAGYLVAFVFAYLLVLKYLEKVMQLFPPLKLTDDINYKAIMIGFPLLTLGIVTGAAWANYAWGTYWSWDPKETWSLIVWFIYAAFLHARFTRGWAGKRAAILSIVGFFATIFCYLGVNLVLSGLHSYGS